jgi:uncharacterized protein (TIGR03435 family)
MAGIAAVLLLAKVTVVTLIGLAAVHAARRSRAAVRHVLLAATFAVAIALPVTSLLAPAISIAVPIPTPARTVEPIDIQIDRDAPASATTAATAPAVQFAQPGSSFPWRAVLLAAWLAGAALCVLPLLVGLRQMRALGRTGLSDGRVQSIAAAIARETGIARRVSVRLHQSTSGPLTYGVIRPAIVLPLDADRWGDDDLRRAVIHELEHIRRHDWLTQCLARVACAAYWYHPLIWIAWRRFALEAERACDDAVLQRSEATAYADQLVDLARRLSVAARQPLLAMANRADLSTRVVAVLDDRQARGRAGTRWIAAAALAALALILIVSPLRLVAAVQSAPAGTAGQVKLRYDAASLKPCVAEAQPTGARGTYGGTNATFSPGRFTVPCVTAGQLIYLAYAAGGVDPADRLINDDAGTAASPQKVRGGPDWVHSLRDKYQVEATAAGVTERTVLMGAMLRTLLEERFKLKLHRDTEEVAMYAMTVRKGGLKIKPMKDGDCIAYDGSPIDPSAARPTCGNLKMMSAGRSTRWEFGGTTLDSLARSVSRALGAPVLDRTGVADRFILTLEFTREGPATDDPQIRDRDGRVIATASPTAPPIATALEEQVGVTLEKINGPRGYLVIDHIERPTPDAPPPMRAVGANHK